MLTGLQQGGCSRTLAVHDLSEVEGMGMCRGVTVKGLETDA